MANRWFLYISELAQKAQQEVTRTPENWQKFLTTASRFYKSYDFDDQLLIYIQRPDAVACADIETWNNKMHRWVNAGSNAIGLIRKGTGGRPYIQNVHDVSDTHRVKGGKDPWLWRMEEAYHAPVMERLAKAFGIPEGGDLGECLMEAASKVSEEHYGQPIGTYMKEYRIKQAAILLRQTQATIAEIANQVGYENQSKFATAFRDVLKIAPAEYRKQNSGD